MKYLLIIFCLISFFSCNTELDPIDPNAAPVFRNEQILGKWKLISGFASLNGAKVIDDIFDVSKNPQAAQTACIKNSILEFKDDLSFVETSKCYEKTEEGVYLFSPTSLKMTYNNKKLENREYLIKTLDALLMSVEYSVSISGLPIVTTLTYQKQ